MIITSVAEVTIRATRRALPGYGASSSLSHSQSHLDPFGGRSVCARDAISTPAYDNDGGLTHAKQVCRRVFNAHSNWKTGRQMNPVESPLHIRQTLVEASNDVSVRSHAETHTIYDP